LLRQLFIADTRAEHLQHFGHTLARTVLG